MVGQANTAQRTFLTVLVSQLVRNRRADGERLKDRD